MSMKFTNNATTTLSANLSNVATSLVVTSGGGALFPTLGAGDYFYCTLANTAGTVEIIKVTARSGDTFTTIVRGQDGTSANSWVSGDTVELRLVSASLNDIPKLDENQTFSGIVTFSNPIVGSVTGSAATATTATNATSATNATNLTGSGSISSTTTATTQTVNDNSTKVATTAYVSNQIAATNIGAGRLLAVQILTAGTSATLNTSTTQVEVGLSGGGGSGGGYNTSNQVGGGGGGAGQYIFIPRFAASGSLAYSLGAGGASVAANTNGNRGGNSTCNGKTAYGGYGGRGIGTSSNLGGAYGGGSNISANVSVGTGGAGGTGTGGGNGSGGTDGSPGIGGIGSAATAATAGGAGAGGGGGGGFATFDYGGGGGSAGFGPNGGNGGNGATTTSSSAAGGGGYIIIWEYA